MPAVVVQHPARVQAWIAPPHIRARHRLQHRRCRLAPHRAYANNARLANRPRLKQLFRLNDRRIVQEILSHPKPRSRLADSVRYQIRLRHRGRYWLLAGYMLAHAQPVYNLPRMQMRRRQKFHRIHRVVIQNIRVVVINLWRNPPLPRPQLRPLPLRIAQRHNLAVRMPQIPRRVHLRNCPAPHNRQPYLIQRQPPCRD